MVKTLNKVQKRWDIFCKIVDNFGDIGVCWRLAKQLQAEHGLQVRLWVDDWAVAAHFIPALKNTTEIEGVSIRHWQAGADFSQAADVVIEAFAGGLPAAYLKAMQAKKSLWINLDYLSAETWVDDFHGKPSPQAGGMVRYFYFPGFTDKTGGLLREKNLIKNHIFQENQQDRQDKVELKVSLFCYPHAPIHDFFNCLQAHFDAVHVFVPVSDILPKVASFFGAKTIKAGDFLVKHNLTIEVLPFLSQQDYDALLRSCDINFVRGEDSWLRAIWAGKPFIWQPYFQTENTHMNKLKSFINLFYANCEQKQVLWKAHEYWAAEHASRFDAQNVWQNYFKQLPAIQAYTPLQAKKQAEQTDLATQLVAFCNHVVFTKE